MPQSHPTRGPYDFSTRTISCPQGRVKRPQDVYVGAVLVVTSGYGPRTAWHGCMLMVWLNNSQDSLGNPCDARTGIVRVLHGNLQCFSFPMGSVRGPCVTRKGAIRRPYGHVSELTQPELAKIPLERRIWSYGPHTGCLCFLNPYGARKLIMHALKLYRPRAGRLNSYGPALGPCGPRRWTYDFCSKP